MLIRPATEADLPQILEIHNHAVRNLDAIWTEAEETIEDRRAWLLDRQNGGFTVLVAVEDDTVLGMASYGTYRSRSGYRKTIEHSIYLREDAQGRGVGKALMEALIADARAKGFHLMVAVIDAKNTGSIAFHERFGFALAGTLPQAGFKHGKWLDQVNMVLLLNDDPAPPRGY
ncbi:GNAT family N-acetyltransferase [Pelagibacterium xiamenense]|uniref:GNAT family N-acetyltransferase n=1 Tax=Pelagibacterium xiamenense TaxID=2901140 RepID=UPI001E359FB3|nr:GNAT family N-acetyltransferase [Pelagibacterium xiamenense]MCD7058748.1 N-acetyltransferase family protein [Pelagibacterium xiamenense]